MDHKERKDVETRKGTEHRADHAKEKGHMWGIRGKREDYIAKENYKDAEEG